MAHAADPRDFHCQCRIRCAAVIRSCKKHYHLYTPTYLVNLGSHYYIDSDLSFAIMNEWRVCSFAPTFTFMNMYHPPISELSFVKWPLADSPKKCSSISSFYETNMYRNSRIFPPFAFIFYFVRLFFYETDFSYDNDAIIRTETWVYYD